MRGLKVLRVKKGMTQADLAEKLNVSINTVWRWEVSRQVPSVEIIREIAKFFNVTVEELLNGLPEGESEGIRVTLVMGFTKEEVVCMSKDKEFRISVDGDEIGIFGTGDFPGDEGIEAFLQKVKKAVLRGRAAQSVDVSSAVMG